MECCGTGVLSASFVSMAIEIIKNGVRGRIESFVGKFLVAEYDPITGLFKAEKTLIVTNSTIDAGFSTEALALSAAEAAGWAEYVVATIPPAPTVNVTTITTGSSINITIAQDGSVLVYRNGSLIETLTNKVIGTFAYTCATDGGYSFRLTNTNGTSNSSVTVVASSVSTPVTPFIFFPYELGKIYTNGSTNYAQIVQSGTFGEIITDPFRGYDSANRGWSLEGGEIQTTPLLNVNLVSLKGRRVHIRVFTNINQTTKQSLDIRPDGSQFYTVRDFKIKIGI